MIIDGKKLALERETALSEKIKDLRAKGVVPKLVSVVGDNPQAQMYVDLKEKVAKRLGIAFERKGFVAEVVSKACQDESVHGVWVQLPLPEGLDELSVVSAIDPKKDVDCLSPVNVGLLCHPNPVVLPATVRAVMTIINSINLDLTGRRVVVVGASPWLGRPLSLVLSNAGATVTMVWETEKNLQEMSEQADMLISAVGKSKLITADMVKEGTIVIDVGVSRVNGSVVGDVDFDDVAKKASYITPVPGGVGPLTVISLMENLMDLVDRPRDVYLP